MRLSKLLDSRNVAYVILFVIVVSTILSGYNSQQQLSQAQHIQRITRCQTAVNNQFNATLKYNTQITNKTNVLSDKDRDNLTGMVARVGAGIKKNDGNEVRKAISSYNSKRKKLDKQRAVLIKSRASYPPLPKDVCK